MTSFSMKKEKFCVIFTYFTVVLWLSTEILFASTLEYIYIWKKSDVNYIMALVVLGLLAFQIAFLQQYRFREMIVLFSISLLIVYATIRSGSNTMMSTWLFVMAMRYIDLDKIIHISYIIFLLFVPLVILMCLSGMINEVTIFRGSLLRHSLGFSHPNQLGLRVFQLILGRTYVRRKKLQLTDYMLTLAAAWFVYRVPNSKSAYYALFLLAGMMLLYQYTGRHLQLHDRFASVLIAVAAGVNVMSVYLSVIHVRAVPYLAAFDRALSYRFSQCHRTLQYYGLSWFGQEIRLIFSRPGIGRTYRFWLDNAYMAILLQYGIVVYLIFSILYLTAMIFFKRNGNYFMVLVLALYAIYGVMERNFYSMSQNMFLLAMSYPLYHRQPADADGVARRRWKLRFTL